MKCVVNDVFVRYINYKQKLDLSNLLRSLKQQ